MAGWAEVVQAVPCAANSCDLKTDSPLQNHSAPSPLAIPSYPRLPLPSPPHTCASHSLSALLPASGLDSPVDSMSSNGSKGVSKPDKGGKNDNDKIIVKVAGVVVATGIAWSLYKTFSRSDHPLVNTESGIKKDAANAYDNTKRNAQNAKSTADHKSNQVRGGLGDAAGTLVHKLEGVGHKVQDSLHWGAHTAEKKAQAGKESAQEGLREGKGYVKDKVDQIDDKARSSKNELENKGWGAKNEVESKAKDAEATAEKKVNEVKRQSRGFFGQFKSDAKDTKATVEDKSRDAKGTVEEKGREAKGALKDAGSNIKGYAQDKKEKVQEAGKDIYGKGLDAKNRIDGKQVTIQKGDTLWGLSRKYNVSVESLKAANGIIVGDSLDAGDVITIPK